MLTVAEALARWLATMTGPSARDARSAADRVRSDLGSRRISDVRTRDVIAWLALLEQSGRWSPNRIRTFLWALRGAFSAAVMDGAVEIDPTRQIPRSALPRRRTRSSYRPSDLILSPHEMGAMLRLAPVLRRAQWATVILSGVRVGELSALRWRDILPMRPLDALVVSRSWSTRRGEMSSTKTGAMRRVPIHPTLAAALERHRDAWRLTFERPPADDDLLYPRRWRGELEPQHQPQILAAWKRDLHLAGLMPRPIHCARHTFLTTAIAHGAAESAAFACTHGDSTIRGVYRHWRWASLCEAVLCIPEV